MLKKTNKNVLSLVVMVFFLFLTPGGLKAKAVPKTAVVTLVYGKAYVERGAKSIKVVPKLKLYSGDKIETEKETKVEIKFFDGSIIRLASSTVVEIKKMEKDTLKGENRISLKTVVGNLWSRVKKVTGLHTKFDTATPTAIAGVRSTTYRLIIDPDTTTVVRIYKGKVEVKTWMEAYEGMIKAKGEEEEEPLGEKEGIEEPYEVEGPTEVTLEEWMRIVSAMQQVVIFPDKVPQEVSRFDEKEDEKDPWVIWNKKRDEALFQNEVQMPKFK